jgi:hypothetical protein
MGLLFGILFGFMLQKGGVTNYDVLMGQLLLTDFTVVKVMLSAVITGMVGIEILRSRGLVTLHPKPGSLGTSAVGGLIFGAGFALLGYCPGTMAGAVGEGRLDALAGGVPGVIFGAWLFAIIYPKLPTSLLEWGDVGESTFPALLKRAPWVIVLPASLILTGLLVLLERGGM